MNEKLLELVPEHIRGLLGTNSKVCLLSGLSVFTALKDENLIVMACNARIKHAIPGIMRAAEELDAVVAFELTATEGGLDGGYTGQTPELYVSTIIEYALSCRFSKPFLIHADHITVQNTGESELGDAARLIAAQLEAGYTSFAIDASFNSLSENIEIVTQLSAPIIAKGYGLEVELGEMPQSPNRSALTPASEARDYLATLTAQGCRPHLLAINNGSKRGNYLEGEIVHIDLERTKKIHEVAVSFGVAGLVQHGITGTPLHLVGKLADYGIRKGNIGTLWQNVGHAGLPLDLMDAMRRWARENNRDIKYATKAFKAEIDAIPETNIKMIHEMAYREAREFLAAFRAKGSAAKLAKILERSR
ncbi:MAG: fructose-bisphosphate aldolase [Deltaproteobacteria bacterium]|nr:fructose-bisphosphate aldolase [Deltaproteobacteria bacterium]TLN04059.1 MAG: class II fructose-bisphosphate aldolase [bacterium]